MVLHELQDPRLGFVTLTEVRMSGDLKIAKVYVSVYGTEEEEAESLEALRHAVGYLRREIGRRLPLRYTPELRFEPDRTIQRADRLEALFADMADGSEGSDDGEADDGGPGGAREAKSDGGAQRDRDGSTPGDDGTGPDG